MNEGARSARVAKRGEAVKARLRSVGSRKPFRAPRRCPLRDDAIALAISRFEQAGVPVRLTSRHHSPVKYVRRGLSEAERGTLESEIDREATTGIIHKDVWVPHWDHTGDRLKIVALCGVVGAELGGTITAHIGESILGRGYASSLGIASYLGDRIQKAVKAEFERIAMPPPEYFFALEDASFGMGLGVSDSLHLHGGYCTALTGREGVCQRRALRKALKAALGAWGAGRRQVQIRPSIETPWKWARYVAKHLDVTGDRLANLGARRATLIAPNAMRSRARRWYEAKRSD